jgi:acyl transferase domain-containing protein/acyl carrier protein
MSDAFKTRIAQLSPQQLQLLALDLRSRLDRINEQRKEPIAVVGMGCRFPGADNPSAFWELLRRGEDLIREVPPDRWNVDAFYDPDPDVRGRMATRWGGFIDRVREFDPEFFGIAPREAHSMDPQQRLLLEVVWEALEDAGLPPDSLRGSRTGVFVGLCNGDYFQICTEHGFGALDTYFATGTAHSVASGRLSYVLGLEGPAITLDTACSSSLIAVHLAVRSIRNGESRMAIAAGVNLVMWPGGAITMSAGRMLAPDGRCKTFDATGDGFVRGEGCGVIILKRLSDAIADGDRVLAVIRGSAANQDGRSNGLTAPNGRAQTALVTDALADADVQPAAISYVETHGTGTPLGDPIELHALGAALTPGRAPGDDVVVGSVKTNIGHLEGAAGMAGVIKTILMLRAKEIPPSIHFTEPNPYIDWASIPVRVATSLAPWQPTSGRRIAGVSSFGLSGSNAHIIVEEAPAKAEPARNPRAISVVPISARTESALREVASRYDALLDGDTPLDDVALTAGAGRAHFEYRAALVGRTREEIRAQLRDLASDSPDATAIRGQVASTTPPRLAFLYSGQGAQFVGMGASLYRTEPVFRAALDRCARILDPIFPAPLLDVIHSTVEGDRRIHEAPYTQAAILSLQFALTELWRSWGVVPDAVMGHSAGEFAAAVTAGVISIEDALPLIVERWRLMTRAGKDGAMLAVFATEERLRAHLARVPTVVIGAYNGPDSLVLSGPRVDIDRIGAALVAAGIETRALEIATASHSVLMEPVLDEFERAVARATLRAPERPLISNLTGDIVGAEIATTSYWRRHLRQPVRFADGMNALVQSGARVFVEIGPHPTLVSIARRYHTGTQFHWLAPLRRDRDDVDQIAEALGAMYAAGASIDWKGVYAGTGAAKAALPTYPFERESYWIDLVPGIAAARADAPRDAPVSASGARVAVVDPARRPRFADWLYELRWERVTRPATATAPSGTWLLVGGPSALRAELATQLAEAKVHTVSVALPKPSDDDFELALGRSLDEASRGGILTRIVYLERSNDAQAQSSGFAGDYERVMHTAFALVRSVVSRGWNAPLWFVTQGATDATRVSDVPASGLVGLRRVIAAEYPNLPGGLLDLDRSSAVAQARAIVAELSGVGDEPTVAVVGGRRLVPRIARVAEHSSNASDDASLDGELREDATYLVTGALGGIGLRLLQWLEARGARHIACLVRRDATGAQLDVLESLRTRGIDVRLIRADVADRTQVANALQTVRATMPPIAGVYHAAGALESVLLERTDWSRFTAVASGKVHGAWNLHEQTRDDGVDEFVLFSSGSVLFGPMGLAAYASANALLDGLAHYRSAEGLPALSVNWGGWVGDGMLTSVKTSVQESWAQSGLSSMAADDAFELLSHIATIDAAPQLVALDMDWLAFFASAKRSALFAPFAPDSPRAELTAAQSSVPAGDAFLDFDALSDDEALAHVSDFLRTSVARELGLPRERISISRSLSALGLDSLMAVQLRNRTEAALRVSVPVSKFIEGLSVEQLATDLVARVQRESNGSRTASAGDTPVAVAAVTVGELSDDEVERMLREMLGGEQGT